MFSVQHPICPTKNQYPRSPKTIKNKKSKMSKTISSFLSQKETKCRKYHL